MFDLSNNNTWHDAVQAYNTTDPVLGGLAGQSNQPVEQLADRTFYLYDRLGRFEDIRVITAATTLVAGDKFKLNYVLAPGNLVVTIDDIAGFQHGAIYRLKCKCPAGKAVTLQTTGGQQIKDGSLSTQTMWLCDGEEVTLAVYKDGTTDHFILLDARGNFDCVGQDAMCRFQPRNTLVANGCTPENGSPLLLRADYPRLWAKAGPTAIDDTTWLSHPFEWRGRFSSGNGTTTFRPPDMRAMFHRALDLGRGVRVALLDNTSGNYEYDENRFHAHQMAEVPKRFNDTDRGGGTSSFSVDTPTIYSTQPQGESEARPKNIGFIPVIFY